MFIKLVRFVVNNKKQLKVCKKWLGNSCKQQKPNKQTNKTNKLSKILAKQFRVSLEINQH